MGEKMRSARRIVAVVLAALGGAFVLMVVLAGLSSRSAERESARKRTAPASVTLASSAAQPQVADATPPSATPRAALQIDKSPAKQEGRTLLLAKLKANGVFAKIDDTMAPLIKVAVGPSFYAAKFDDKEAFCSVVYAYYATEVAPVIVELRDDMTGKAVGTYQPGFTGIKLELE